MVQPASGRPAPIYWPGGVPSLGVGGRHVLFLLIENKEDGRLSLSGYDFDLDKPSTMSPTACWSCATYLHPNSQGRLPKTGNRLRKFIRRSVAPS